MTIKRIAFGILICWILFLGSLFLRGPSYSKGDVSRRKIVERMVNDSIENFQFYGVITHQERVSCGGARIYCEQVHFRILSPTDVTIFPKIESYQLIDVSDNGEGVILLWTYGESVVGGERVEVETSPGDTIFTLIHEREIFIQKAGKKTCIKVPISPRPKGSYEEYERWVREVLGKPKNRTRQH